jgi:hypothetical protein
MPPALDRLLASPSALRLLRSIVNGPEVPAASAPAAFCCHTKTFYRQYTSDQLKPRKSTWRRWDQHGGEKAKRDQIRQILEADETLPGSEDNAKFDAIVYGLNTGREASSSAAAWAALLLRRERHEGQRGIMAVWKLRHQAQYNLPVDSTEHTEYLWGTFLKHPQLVLEVIDHAAELLRTNKETYTRLYPLVLIYWLPRNTKKVLDYHHHMLSKLEVKTIPLKEVARYGRSIFKPAAYQVLMEIYRASEQRDMYDEVVPPLVEKGHILLARRWHNLCMFRHDLPSEAVANHPVVRILTAESSMLSNPKNSSQESLQQSGKYNGELMRRLLGRDTAPVRFEDSFCASMFATRSFPPSSVIHGLAMVGVNEIGPQAVRAMASCTEPLEDLPEKFQELRANGIALQGCVYSLAMEKFAKDQNWKLVRSMLDSDQHPDVFDDVQVQRELLEYYLNQEDHAQLQRTLAILTLFHTDSSQESWNLLLQANIRRTGPQHITEVLQDMRVRGAMVTKESIAAIRGLLRRRQIGRKPVNSEKSGFDDLRFVTRVYMTILEFGMGSITPREWRELIRRFGMTGRFKELRRLLLWLLCWYAPRSSIQFSHLPVSPFRERAMERLKTMHPERNHHNHYFRFPGNVTQHDSELHPIRQLFPPPLMQALIIWGFRAGLLPNANLEQSLYGSILGKKHYRRKLLQRQILQRAGWSIGLRTVVLLRDLGVYVHHHTVVKALQMQFIVLFGHGVSNKIENRVMEDTNSVLYARCVRNINKHWGSQLLKEPQLFHKGMIHNHMWHPRMRRRIDRKASVNLNEVLGPGWRNRNDARVESATAKAAYRELEGNFAAQARAQEPGPQWIHEAGFNTTGSSRSSGQLGTGVGGR